MALKLKRPNKKQLLIIVTVTLLVAGGSYLWLQLQKESVDDSQVNQQATVAEDEDFSNRQSFDLSLEQKSIDDLRSKVDQFTFSGQYDEATQLLRYQDDFDSNLEVQKLYAVTLVNSGNEEGALKVYKQMADTFSMTANIANNIGDLSRNLGDKEQARKYYGIAIKQFEDDPSQSAMVERDIIALEEKINDL